MVRLPSVERGIGYLENRCGPDYKTSSSSEGSRSAKPVHTLDAIGIVDHSGAHYFGLVLRLPRWSSDPIHL